VIRSCAEQLQSVKCHKILLCVDCLAAEFDAAKHLNTHRDLLGRTHNRLTLDKLKTSAINSSVDDESLAVSVIEILWQMLIDPFAALQPCSL